MYHDNTHPSPQDVAHNFTFVPWLCLPPFNGNPHKPSSPFVESTRVRPVSTQFVFLNQQDDFKSTGISLFSWMDQYSELSQLARMKVIRWAPGRRGFTLSVVSIKNSETRCPLQTAWSQAFGGVDSRVNKVQTTCAFFPPSPHIYALVVAKPFKTFEF